MKFELIFYWPIIEQIEAFAALATKVCGFLLCSLTLGLVGIWSIGFIVSIWLQLLNRRAMIIQWSNLVANIKEREHEYRELEDRGKKEVENYHRWKDLTVKATEEQN